MKPPYRRPAVVAAVGVVAVLAATLTRGPAQDVVVVAAGALTFGFVLTATRRRSPPRNPSLGWLLVGLACLWLSDALWLVRVDVLGLPALAVQALPLVLGYVALLVAALHLLLAPRPRPSGALLDSALIAVSAAMVIWQLVLRPFAEDVGMADAQQSAAIVVLIVQAATIGAAMTTHHTSTSRPLPLALFSAAAVVLTASSLGRAVTTASGSTASAWWPGPALVLAYALVACALAHPAAAGLVTREVRRSGHMTAATVIATGAALAIGPALSLAHDLASGHRHDLLWSVSTLTLIPVVLTRIWLLSRSREEAEARLAWMAHFDELTGLANRRELGERLEQSVARVQAGEVPAVVVTFGDLNGFKQINDVHGHHVGDEVLAVIARRLLAAVRQEDLVARFGGDEFVVVAEGDPQVLASETVRRVTAVVGEPVQIGDVSARVGISTGTAIGTPGPGLDADRLLSAADASMYRQKRAHRHGVLRTTALPRLPAPAPNRRAEPPTGSPTGD